MIYQIIESKHKAYIEYDTSSKIIANRTQVMDIVLDCSQNCLNNVMIDAQLLSEAFLDKYSGFSEIMIKTLTQQEIRMAVVVGSGNDPQGKYFALLDLYKSGKYFRTFSDRSEADYWLTKQ